MMEQQANNLVRGIRAGQNTYTRLDGIAPLREAIATKLASYDGIHADPDSEILVTAGATGALYTAALALLDPGDEVILFEPLYGYHSEHDALAARAAGRRPHSTRPTGVSTSIACVRPSRRAPAPSSSTRRPIPAARYSRWRIICPDSVRDLFPL